MIENLVKKETENRKWWNDEIGGIKVSITNSMIEIKNKQNKIGEEELL